MHDIAKPRPVIVVADADASGAVVAALQHRYASDYEVVAADGDPNSTLDTLSAARRRVALVLAGPAPATGGETVFARTARVFPDARRALLLGWGAWADPGTAAEVLALMSDLQIDYYVIRPSEPADEDFHRTITEFLREWRAAAGARRGFVVIGAAAAPRVHVLGGLLARGGLGVTRLDPDSPEAARILAAAGLAYAGSPVVRTEDGRVLVDPDDRDLAEARGLATSLPDGTVDLAIVGAGPGGLAAAVYAASEGLSTLVIEQDAVGGQAGSSSLIRNYLGFPRGVSGAELAGRAYQQAWAFGAQFAHMRTAIALDITGSGFALTVSPGAEPVSARSVVLATGVSYRRLAVPALRPFVGASVFYGASSSEARGQRGRAVCVVGGGNSAGQAALHLARYATSVALLVRGPDLAESMSAYLIVQLRALGVTIETRTRVSDARTDDEGRLSAIEVEDLATGQRRLRECHALFITIGARPHTQWLPPAVMRDRWGYIVTGASPAGDDLPGLWGGGVPPGPLEASVPGLFAVGDTRRGALKRVAAAVGEGSTVVSAVHAHLARR